MKLKNVLKTNAVKKGLPWFDLVIEDFLAYVGSVLADDFEEKKCVHYTNMELDP